MWMKQSYSFWSQIQMHTPWVLEIRITSCEHALYDHHTMVLWCFDRRGETWEMSICCLAIYNSDKSHAFICILRTHRIDPQIKSYRREFLLFYSNDTLFCFDCSRSELVMRVTFSPGFNVISVATGETRKNLNVWREFVLPQKEHSYLTNGVHYIIHLLFFVCLNLLSWGFCTSHSKWWCLFFRWYMNGKINE